MRYDLPNAGAPADCAVRRGSFLPLPLTGDEAPRPPSRPLASHALCPREGPTSNLLLACWAPVGLAGIGKEPGSVAYLLWGGAGRL